MLVLLASLTSISVNAQQDPMYSQYMFNMVSVNPAYTGARDMLTMTAMYRKQWVGVEGAPTTMTFSIDAPVKNQRMALGLNVVNDQIGISKNLTMNALYAYRVRFNNRAILSLGLQAGLGQYSADYTSVRTSNNYGGTDSDRAFGSNVSQFFPNAGFGAYYYSNRFFAGIGVPKLIKNNLAGLNRPTLDFTSFMNRQNRHMFISSGYTFDLNQDWQAKPSVMVKGVKGAPLQTDINFNAWWKNSVGAGISYRTSDAVVAMVEFKPRKEIHIGYAFDYTVSQFSGANGGSHELLLRYEPHASKVRPQSSSVYKSRPAYKSNPKKYQTKKRKQINKRRSKIR